jgi:hypothetical protein
MTWCTRRLVRGVFVLLPALLLIGFVLYESMDAMHHWFNTLMVMGAVAALFNGTSLKRIALAGVPHLLGYNADHLQPFQDYLYQHYRKTKVFSNGKEDWERKDIQSSNRRRKRHSTKPLKRNQKESSSLRRKIIYFPS